MYSPLLLTANCFRRIITQTKTDLPRQRTPQLAKRRADDEDDDDKVDDGGGHDVDHNDGSRKRLANFIPRCKHAIFDRQNVSDLSRKECLV